MIIRYNIESTGIALCLGFRPGYKRHVAWSVDSSMTSLPDLVSLHLLFHPSMVAEYCHGNWCVGGSHSSLDATLGIRGLNHPSLYVPLK